MAEETKEELQHKLDLIEAIRKEREVTDRLYAIKLVEKIVFAECALILVAVLTAIVAAVVNK